MSQNVCSGDMPNSDIDGTAISKEHVQMGQDGDLGRTVSTVPRHRTGITIDHTVGGEGNLREHIIPIRNLFLQSREYLGIPGVATDELRFAFLRATSPLCPDIQRKIWEEVIYCTEPVGPPPAPKKCSAVSYRRSSGMMTRSRTMGTT